MCGYLISSGKRTISETQMYQASVDIRKRGPDSYTYYTDPNKGIYSCFARLILSGEEHYGQQPAIIKLHDNEKILFFNGEIFNYTELAELMKIPLLSGEGDTAFIEKALLKIELYDLVPLLKGMFSITLIDKKNDKIFLVRDFFGKNPLYYSYDKQGLVIGSLAHSVSRIFHEKVQLNSSAIYEFLLTGSCSLLSSAFDNVHAVPPSTILEFKNNVPIKETRYKPKLISNKKSFIESLNLAISRRVNTKRKTGILLSDGVDSNLIKTLVQKHFTYKIPSVTVNFLDNLTQTNNTKDHKRTYVGINKNDYIESIKDFALYSDDPVNDPVTPVLSMAMKRGFDDDQVVIFSGDGGDELDAGYHWYKRKQIILRIRALSNKIKIPKKEFLFRKFFFNQRVADLLLCHDKDFLSILRSTCPMILLSEFKNFFDAKNPYRNEIDDLFEFDLTYFLPQTILKKNDRSSTMHGKEIRTPFLDEDLFLSHRETSKLGKKRLRSLYHSLSLKKIIKKEGFDLPLTNWLNADVLKSVDEVNKILLDVTDISENNLLLLKSYVESGKSGRYIPWNFVQMLYWLKRF